MIFTDQALKASEWCNFLGVEIMDADGWEDANIDEPCQLDEFIQRLRQCTMRFEAHKVIRTDLVSVNASIFFRGNGDPYVDHEIIGVRFGRGSSNTFSVGACPEVVDEVN